MAERSKKPIWVWVLGGCGVLLVLGVCGMCVLPRLFTQAFLDDYVVPEEPEPPAYSAGPGGGGSGTGPFLPDPRGPIRAPGAAAQEGQVGVTMLLTSVSGTVGVAAETLCSFTVRRVSQGNPMRCQTIVDCAGVVLYGGTESGFFECTMDERFVTGSDTATTASDGDAAFEIDTASGIVRIRDDESGPQGAFSVQATIRNLR